MASVFARFPDLQQHLPAPEPDPLLGQFGFVLPEELHGGHVVLDAHLVEDEREELVERLDRRRQPNHRRWPTHGLRRPAAATGPACRGPAWIRASPPAPEF